jgi:SAM-dependent methyltransferase
VGCAAPERLVVPDVAFYRDLILRGVQPALDLGCATGRLVLGHLQEGLDVDGVDVAPEMLARVRAKVAELGLAPRLYQRSMDTLDLPRRHGTIVVSSSTFQLLTDHPFNPTGNRAIPQVATEVEQARRWRRGERGKSAMGGCLGWACTLALVLALHACASPPAADSAAGGVGTVEAAATKPVGSVEALVIRVRGKNYSVVGEANTRLTDADIEAALGPYQAPKTWSAAVQPWTA